MNCGPMGRILGALWCDLSAMQSIRVNQIDVQGVDQFVRVRRKVAKRGLRSY